MGAKFFRFILLSTIALTAGCNASDVKSAASPASSVAHIPAVPNSNYQLTNSDLETLQNEGVLDDADAATLGDMIQN